jgi:hypothetical protein
MRKYGTGTGADIYINIPKAGSANHALNADWTPAAGDVKISKDGGAAANIGTLPVAVAMGNSAIWKFVFSDAELQAAFISVTISDSATKAVDDTGFSIETYGNASALHAFDLDTATQKVDVDTIKTNPVVNGGTVTFPTNSTLASTTNITGGTITTVTTVTNQLTAAQIATGVWQDATPSDFTTASSIGKSLYTTGNAPGAASGLALVGSNMGTVSSVTGNVSGSVNSVTSGVTVATGGVGTGDIDSTALNEIADAILDRVMSAGADSGGNNTTSRTVRQALRTLRNKVANAAGTLTVYKEDDTTTSFTAAVGTTAGDPISSIDPT